MESYYVYVLLCADRSLYTGITNDPDVRVVQHQEGTDPRSYTFTRRPVKLIHCSEFHQVADAIAWEKQFKGWSRAKKVALISGNFALVHELAKPTKKPR